MLTADEIKIKARSLGFDLCGVAPPAGFAELEFLKTWLDNGYAGEMQYMSSTGSRRCQTVAAIGPNRGRAGNGLQHPAAVIDRARRSGRGRHRPVRVGC